MIQVLVTSTVLIAAILALRYFLKGRVNPRVIYALWALAALRLLLPVSVPLSVSVMNRVDTAPAQSFIDEHIVYIPTQNIPPTAQTVQPADAGAASAEQHQDLAVPWIYLLWAGGAAVVGGYFLFVNLRFSHRIKKERRIHPDCHSKLPVYEADSILSPCLFGVLHPSIYITPKSAQDLQMLRHVLVHETCHYRQKDHIWAFVRVLCVSLYWFHPLVWIAAACSRNDSELSCDQLVIETIGEKERIPYGKTLLEMVQHDSSLSNLGCTATTMSGKASKIKQRITMLLHTPRTTAWVITGIVLCSVVLVSCTFTGRQQIKEESGAEAATPQEEEGPLSAEQAVDQLMQSLSVKDGVVSFTIPKGYPDPSGWWISVYGNAANTNGRKIAELFLFEERNNNREWEPGKTYQIDLNEREYFDLHLEVFPLTEDEEWISRPVDLLEFAKIEPNIGWQTVSITFPSYPIPEDENGIQTDVEPFDVRMTVPSNWLFSVPREEEGVLYAPIIIHDTENRIGSIGFNLYEPTTEPIAPEDEYKSVLSELRLNRMDLWSEYTAVRRTEHGESAICGIIYMDPEYMEEHPDADWASVPEKETVGITIYDRERKVYAALRFDSETSVPQEMLQTIAQSIEIVPSDYGLTGRRYQGDYAPRDYSKIKIVDAQGNDISKIVIDLWYCASDMCNVDGYVMFEMENGPKYDELIDYNEVMPTVFTENGIRQYEACPVVDLQKKDGRVYRLGPWKTGYHYAKAMTDMKAIETKEDEITMRVTCEMPSFFMASAMPDYQPEYNDTLFTVKKENGIWLVEDYLHFEDPAWKERMKNQ